MSKRDISLILSVLFLILSCVAGVNWQQFVAALIAMFYTIRTFYFVFTEGKEES